MSEESRTLTLSPSEYRLVKAVRDMPESPLKFRLMDLLDRLAGFARNPRCPQMQPDGVPCETPESDCDQCRIVLGMFEKLEKNAPLGPGGRFFSIS